MVKLEGGWGARLLGIAICLAFLVGDVPAGEPELPPPVLVVQMGHTQAVGAVDLAPDGRTLLTTAGDETVRLWDADAGYELLAISGFRGGRRSAALAPDGRTLAYTTPLGHGVLYDVETREEIRRFEDVQEHAVAISPDGSAIAFGSGSGEVRLFPMRKRKPTVLTGHTAAVNCAAWGSVRDLYTGSLDGTVRRWTQKGRPGVTYRGHGGGVLALDLAAEGERLITLARDGIVRVWKTSASRKPLSEFRIGQSGDAEATDLASDGLGRRVALARADGTVELWDLEDEKRVHTWNASKDRIAAVDLAPDARTILAATGSRVIRIDVASREIRDAVSGHALALREAAISGDDRTITVLDHQSRVWVIDSPTGQCLRPERPHTSLCVAPSPGGRTVLTGDSDRVIRMWQRFSGETLREFRGHQADVQRVAFSPDGYRMLSADKAGTVLLWDVTSGTQIRSLKGLSGPIVRLVVSARGERVAAMTGEAVCVWDLRTGEMVGRHAGSAYLQDIDLTADGKRLAVRNGDLQVDLLDLASSRVVQTYPGRKARPGEAHTQAITCFTLAPNGKQLVTGAWDQTLRLWDVKSGKMTGVLGTVDDNVHAVDYTSDGRLLVTCGADKMLRVWDVASRRQRLTATFEADGTWCAFDAEGRIDSNDPARVRSVRAVRGRTSDDLASMTQAYYEPALWAKVFGWSVEPLRSVDRKQAPEAPPVVTALQKTPGEPVYDVVVKDRGGGIGALEVHLNGKRVRDDARGGTVSATTVERATVDLRDDPRLLPGEENRIEFGAWNRDRTARARGRRVTFKAPGEKVERGALWAIVCGVSDYESDTLDLRYAARDAKHFASALELAAHRHFGVEQTHIQLLVAPAPDGGTAATRANLVAAFKKARACSASDVFVVYLAGHGISDASGYRFLLRDAKTDIAADLTPEAAIDSQTLMTLIREVPAVRRQLLILDTCAAGKVRDELRTTASSADARAYAAITQATGMNVLAGCAADKVAYEAGRFGHGLLTYALLHGMSCGCPLQGGTIDAHRLIRYAWEMVPVFSGDLGRGEQRPVKSESDLPFELGRLTAEDRLKIPLQAAKPMLIRSSFQESELAFDDAGLSPAVDEVLQAASRRAVAQSSFVFVETTSMAGAYQLAGRYTSSGSKTTVNAVVIYTQPDGKRVRVGTFTVEGSVRTAKARAALAEQILLRGTQLASDHRK